MANAITPGPDYDAALWGATLGVRRDQRFFGVTGNAPGQMLNGIVTNSLPGPFGELEDGWMRGSVAYSALLTAKGRMITDLRIFFDPDGGFVLDLPHVGAEGAGAHFKKFLPPRLAKVEDRSHDLVLLTLLGPEAPSLLAKTVARMGISLSTGAMADLTEGEELLYSNPGGGAFRVSRTGQFHAHGWDLLLSEPMGRELGDLLMTGGIIPLTPTTLEILRVEKGRPAFGTDMDENTIPVEAGIQGRAIDYQKGCYTGQEVIIRVRDRGHVNKELRGLLMGDAPVPPSGQELFQPGRDKSLGWITSAVASPAFDQTAALGYLRRGVEPGEVVWVGGTDGFEAQVMALSDEGWVFTDPGK